MGWFLGMNTKKTKSQILKKRAKGEKRGYFPKVLRLFIALSLLMIISTACLLFAGYYYFKKDLPKITSLKDYRPPVITTVYSDDGRKIAEFFKERRILIPLENMPGLLIKAFVAAEDSRFYVHEGIDFFGVMRAFIKNIEAGAIVQGGSTITQQVTKSFFLTPEKSYSRKIKEAILSYRLDKTFKKDEILYLYLNQIYLGHGAYGVEAAAENYFGKSVKEMNLAECAMLAGLPQAPSKYSPFRHPERAKKRQIYVLNRMVSEGFITNSEATEAINTELDIKPRRNFYIEKVPYYTEHVRRYIQRKYGDHALYRDGLKINTAVDIDMQHVAREEIEKGTRALDKRQGYRGPLEHLAPEAIEAFCTTLQKEMEDQLPEDGSITKAVVTHVDNKEDVVTLRIGNSVGKIGIEDMSWAGKPDLKIYSYQRKISHPGEALSQGDVIQARIKGKIEEEDIFECALEQEPEIQAALLCMEAETGYIKMMVGGRDFRNSQFNRATQSRRQPGSAFKPVIYAAALDKGYTTATEILDTPIVFTDEERDFTWKPKNYEEKFFGPTFFRTALVKSHNIVTIKILKEIGVDYAINYAKNLGIKSLLSRDLSIALGSSGMSLLETVNVYSVFANLGYLVTPIFITKVENRDGEILEETYIEKKRAIEKSTAYIMTNILEDVVKHGTGRRVLPLGRPVAGKTGTTNNLYDAWFVGYTPHYVTGAWVGYDKEQPLGRGETGARAASPIWLGFMKRFLAEKPVRVFQVPEGVVFTKIDADTGKLAIPESKRTIFECFKEGTEPTEYTSKPDTVTETEQFFKSGI